MKKILLLLSITFLLLTFNIPTQAQLPDGSTAPDWTMTDLNGNSYNLYDMLDNGKTVFIDFSATWCAPCWSYHISHAFRDLYNQYGPNGTNEVRVFFIEGDLGTSESCLYGSSSCSGGTQGDWTAGTPYPILHAATGNEPNIANDYSISYWPTIYAICPNKKIYEAGQLPTSQLAEYINSCGFEKQSITATNVDCYESEDGTVDLEVSGGSSPITYEWSNGASTQDLDGVPQGTYDVTATENNGIQVTATATVSGPDSPVSITLINKNNVGCNGEGDGSIEVEGSGGTNGYTYTWSNGDTGPVISNLSGGDYTVTVTDANNCVKVRTETITEPEVLEYSYSSLPVICENNDGQIDIVASGGTDPYTYDIGNGPQSSNHFDGLTLGTYSVTVTDDNGCTEVNDIYVDEIFPPTVVVPQNDLELPCDGSTLMIDGSESDDNQNFYFEWTTTNGHIVSGVNELIVEVDEAGDYTLSITDATTNCSRSATTTVVAATGIPTADAGAEKQIECDLPEVTLDGSGSSSGNNFTYQWTTTNGHIVSGAQSLMPTVDASGDYQLEVTNSNSSCSATSTVQVTANQDLPEITVSSDGNINCNQSQVTLDGTGSESGDDIVYEWTDAQGNVISTDLIVDVNSGGNYTFSVINNANGCMVIQTVQVEENVNPPAIAVESENGLTCNRSEVTINSDGSATDDDIEYNWSTPDGNIVSDTENENITVDEAGTYILSLNNTTTGCSSADTAIVTEFINTPEAAYEQTVEELEVSFNDNSQGDPTSYSWDFGDGNTSTDASPTHTYEAENTYEVCLTIENECGTDKLCKSISVTKSQIVVSTQITPVSCYGGSDGAIVLSVQGGSSDFTFEWDNGMDSEDIDSLVAGDYEVLITSPDGNTLEQTYTVTQPDSISITTNQTVVSCFGGNDADISADVEGGTKPYSYEWNTGATDSLVTDISAGSYSLTVTDDNQCVKEIEEIEVMQPDKLDYKDLDIVESTDGSSISLTVVGGTPDYEYLWSNGATTEDINDLSDGDYSLTVTDVNGCSKEFGPFSIITTSINTIGKLKSFTAYPNPATDVLRIQLSFVNSTSLHLQLFNQLGEVMYDDRSETNNYDTKIPVHRMNSGLYLLKIQTSEGFATKAIIIQ